MRYRFQHSNHMWRKVELLDATVFLAGQLKDLETLVSKLKSKKRYSYRSLLREQNDHFGLVAVFKDKIFISTDRIQSYPIYYELEENGGLVISTTGSEFRHAKYKDRYNRHLEPFFLASGYTVGSETLISGVNRLLPGQLVEFTTQDERVVELKADRYFIYAPNLHGQGDENRLASELNEVLDEVTVDLINKAEGRKICLMLSAGLDSRLILAKLVQHGYRDLQAFSYGSVGNMEGREARAIAERLGVPWEFVPPRKEDVNHFLGADGFAYGRFASGVTTTAVFTEFYALRRLKRRGFFGDDFLFVNGQTGDFLTGGHLRNHQSNDEALDWIRDKHFSLFDLKEIGLSEEKVRDYLYFWLSANQSEGMLSQKFGGHTLNLMMEWQERQCNYVVNSMRAYDWHHQLWSLPLWHPLLMDFFNKVPLNLQLQQRLYFKFLTNWNYQNLFNPLRRPYDPWCYHGTFIKTLAWVIGKCKSESTKQDFYRKSYYYSDLWYLYRFFGWQTYKALNQEIRSPASLFSLLTINQLRQELGLDISPFVPLQKSFN